MPWTERQAAMLAEMGIKLWPTAVEGDAVVVDEPPPAAAAPVPSLSKDRAEPVEAREPLQTRPPPAVVPVKPIARGERPVGIESMDWPALREAVVNCTACKLCESRRQTVFGVGHEHAHWMIVGEAPGEQEDRQGEPFVGKSGHLLDNMLRALGLGRNETPPTLEGGASDP